MSQLAAAAAAQGADISGSLDARAFFGVGQSILEAAKHVHANAKAVHVISTRASDMAKAVAEVLSDELLQLQPEVLDSLRTFEKTLLEVQASLRSLGSRSFLSRVLHQQRDGDKLLALSERIGNEFQLLKLQLCLSTSLLTASLLSRVQESEARWHVQLDSPSEVTSESSAAASIPPRPCLHFGRDTETRTVVQLVSSGSAGRVTILGGPGMGKTTLAVTVLHDLRVAARFGARRFFVPCDASEGNSDCFSTLCAALGIVSTQPKSAQQKVRALLGSEPAILVLDNFESAWEGADQRSDAESMLLFLSSMDNLSLIVTLRGSERPQGVPWSRPFLPPLCRLSDAAAKQTFLAIADPRDADSATDQLLLHMDNIPLAVVLVANLAQTESTDSLLHRWNMVETSMLERGGSPTRLTSLSISIGLSLQSPRMQALPTSQRLLSMLSLLPNGVVDTDVCLWNLDHSAEALSALLQNSLATRTLDHRVYVLAPIRSFMLAHHPPDEGATSLIYKYYFDMAKVARDASTFVFQAETFSSVASELANIESLIRYALKHSPEAGHSAIKAIIDLCGVHINTGMGHGPWLLSVALTSARAQPNSDILIAEVLLEWAYQAFNGSVPGDPSTLAREARDIYQRMQKPLLAVDCRILLARFLPPKAAADEVRELLHIARTEGWQRTTAVCIRELALALSRAGQQQESIAQYEEGIALIQADWSHQPHELVGYGQFHIARLRFQLGELAQAISGCTEAYHSFEAAHSARGVVIAQSLLAHIFLNTGHPLQAIENAKKAIEVPTDATGPNPLIQALTQLAEANAQVGDADAAAFAMERTRQLTPEAGFSPATRNRVLRAGGLVAMWRGDLCEARALLNAACTAAQEPDPVEHPEDMLENVADSMEALSEAEIRAGRTDDASVHTVCAAILYRKANTRIGSVRCLLRLAELVDDEFAERLLGAVRLPLQRMGCSYGLAITSLVSAVISRRRGEWETARSHACNAFRRFGDVKDERRIETAREMIEGRSMWMGEKSTET